MPRIPPGDALVPVLIHLALSEIQSIGNVCQFAPPDTLQITSTSYVLPTAPLLATDLRATIQSNALKTVQTTPLPISLRELVWHLATIIPMLSTTHLLVCKAVLGLRLFSQAT